MSLLPDLSVEQDLSTAQAHDRFILNHDSLPTLAGLSTELLCRLNAF